MPKLHAIRYARHIVPGPKPAFIICKCGNSVKLGGWIGNVGGETNDVPNVRRKRRSCGAELSPDPDYGAPGGDRAANQVRAEQSFGEDLQRTLDVNTWLPGDLSREYSRIEREVREAVDLENELQQRIRDEVFPIIGTRQGAGRGPTYTCGIPARCIHRGLLFSGGVEACDGTHQVHDTFASTIYRIGVSLVSYRGDQGTWCQRLFRRDLRVRGADPVTEVTDILRRRDMRGGLNQPSRRDALSEMARRAIMSYAERAILLEKSDATWRMGRRSPAPGELMTGAGSMDLMIESVKVLRWPAHHQKFVRCQ